MIAKRIKLFVEMPHCIARYVVPMLFLAIALPGRAQQMSPASGPPPPPPESAPAPPPNPPAQPVFDPYNAQKSIDVGKFYMDKGDYDAAISRFQDATQYQPKLAVPWELMGEAWEKKHDKEKAVAAYQKFLELLPNGADSEKIRKRVAKLQDDIAHEAKKVS